MTVKRNRLSHEHRYIHIPKRWLRLFVFVPSLLMAKVLWDFGSGGSWSFVSNHLNITLTGGGMVFVIFWLVAANLLALTFAWYRKRLVVALVVALVGVLAVALVGALVGVLSVALVGNEEEEEAWWYFDD